MDTSKTTDEQALIDKVIGSQINIPSQPTILLELDKLINNPNNQLSAISNLINKDAGLSAAIFKLINSSFYKSSTPITSIKKAISVLGLTQVSSLIKGLSLRKAIGGQALSYEKFRERSGEIATLCALIAERQISACNISVDQACMAGLFHECGVPILMQRFPAYC